MIIGLIAYRKKSPSFALMPKFCFVLNRIKGGNLLPDPVLMGTFQFGRNVHVSKQTASYTCSWDICPSWLLKLATAEITLLVSIVLNVSLQGRYCALCCLEEQLLTSSNMMFFHIHLTE